MDILIIMRGQDTNIVMARLTLDCYHTAWAVGRQMVVYRLVAHGAHAGRDCLDVWKRSAPG